jgi:molybdate transport system ATP-binding protein
VVLQADRPSRIYRSPRNRRVAELVGIQNRFVGRWAGPAGPADRPGMGWLDWLIPTPDGVDRPALRLCVADKGRIEVGQQVTWVIQGDGLSLQAPVTDGHVALAARVSSLRHLGEVSLATVSLEALPGVEVRLTVSGPARAPLQANARVTLCLDPSWVHVMPSRNPGPDTTQP